MSECLRVNSDLCSFEGAGRGEREKRRVRKAEAESEAKRTGSERERPEGKFPVTIAGGHHLYPYRTQKLSLQTLMVLSWERLGRVGSCRDPQGAGGTEVFPALEHKEERGRSGSRARCEAEAVAKAERKRSWKQKSEPPASNEP